MKSFYSISFFTLSLLSLIPSSLFSQSPQSIPYQAVVRNADGTTMSNAVLTMIFKIHDVTATGTVVYQESQALTSNAQGLVSCFVGNGTAAQGTFSNINWGSGAKFLHVLMNSGNGEIDLGTQQMMSVPYALYAGQTSVRVSATGDTLLIGGQSVIVPGISSANVIVPVSNSGLGAVLLPGNTTCSNEFISVTGCGGQSSLTYDGRTYDLVEIGGQCWFADNLATDQYRNGDLIPTGLDGTAWAATTSGAFAIYNDDPANDAIYGKLYNWYTTVDPRGVCPTGWHVPTDCEWMYLENSVGMLSQEQITVGWRGVSAGGTLKSNVNWTTPNSGATNSSGFTAFPSGYRYSGGSYEYLINFGLWWSSTQVDEYYSWSRWLYYGNVGVYRDGGNKRNGFAIRCLKD